MDNRRIDKKINDIMETEIVEKENVKAKKRADELISEVFSRPEY